MTRSDRFKHLVIIVCFFIACAFASFAARAATGNATINYTPPTQYEDGTTLPATAIAGYAVSCTFTPNGGGAASACALDVTQIPGGTSRSATVKVTYPVVGGTACFVLKTVTTSGAQSDGSQPPACQPLPAVQPNDPTNLTITITLALNISSDTPIRVAVNEPVVTQEKSP
jgi:hypothetical protein